MLTQRFTTLESVAEYLEASIADRLGNKLTDNDSVYIREAMRAAMHAALVVDPALQQQFVDERNIQYSIRMTDKIIRDLMDTARQDQNNGN